jgi:uncharacterized membrane protein
MSDATIERSGAQNSAIGAVRWTFAFILCLLVAAYGFAYFTPILSAPDNIAANAFARPWLMVHIGGAATALLIAPFQLARSLRTQRPRAHRLMGRVYVAACVVGGAAGVVLAAGASAGPIASAGFGLLGVAWLGATLMGWRAALARRFADHRAWMIRSFALAFAAVTLRLYLPVSFFMPIPAIEAYRAIAFLCWVPNLIVAETYLQMTRARSEAVA